MVSCLRLPSSAALMIIACHKRRLLDVLIGGQNKRVLLDLARTTQISSAVRDWLKAPDATVNYNAKRHPVTGRETAQPFNQQLNMLSPIFTQ
jgi:mitochondrial fission protein ELM1